MVVTKPDKRDLGTFDENEDAKRNTTLLYIFDIFLMNRKERQTLHLPN